MPPAHEPEGERELNVHIFSVSAQMVGVCLTVERAADVAFAVALALMTAVCALIAWTLL